MKRFCLIILFSVVFIAIYANQDKNKSNSLNDLCNCIDKNEFRYFKIDSTIYYFKVTEANDKLINGVFFELNEKIFANLENFQIKQNKKTYQLIFRDKSIELTATCSKKDNYFLIQYSIAKSFLKIFKTFSDPYTLVVKPYTLQNYKDFPKRFLTPIFDSITISKDIKYGNTKAYWVSYPDEEENYASIISKGLLSTITKKNLDLTLDLYMPQNDTYKQRPLIMFIHGGGFYIGDKQSKGMVEWCKYFAKLGYVTVSINYRLGFRLSASAVERTGYSATQDAHAAMRYMVENAEKYKIDTSLIVVAGTSAGAITALNLTFMRNKNRPESSKTSLINEDLGNIESSGNELKNKFSIKAVVNMWGAINDLNLLNNANTAILSFHGDNDKIVSINYDYPFQDIKYGINTLIMNKMYGSLPIHIRAKELKIKEKLNIYENAGHSLHVDNNNNLNNNFIKITNDIKDFLAQEIILGDKYKIHALSIKTENHANKIYKINCNKFKSIAWQIEGGLIISSKINLVKVIWFENVKKHKLSMSLILENGYEINDYYEF